MYNIVYLAHPLRGKNKDIDTIATNMERTRDIANNIVKQEPNTLVLSPNHAFSFLSPFGDQTIPLNMCKELLKLADEVRFYGDWENSEGCILEHNLAKELGMKIVYK